MEKQINKVEWITMCPHQFEEYCKSKYVYTDKKNNNTGIPPPKPNGGLYNGPQSTKPWSRPSVPPTEEYYTNVLLRSANPPPGAINQYQGSGNRLGNSNTPTVGLYWNNPLDDFGNYYERIPKNDNNREF